ncbi:ArsR/SmtB family transcription factor [Kitasatospora kifunensis]|uniref:DNA-binding transcriptional ArsR family regulator n=1 Tax=Kitasatospora kifunensis TaxID=58351 RepID=A0A7W7VYX8_KITKI|nr:helix-turn-helix domain-containing protein [Kitasatospora kifunensis]MBB4927164.1 DNA-binding transcriptional ArsR family regulator [Kitasatospora kifunensis]
MGWWQVDTDTLMRSRFALSPLAEVIASLKTLERGTAAHPGERAWLAEHLPACRERRSGDPVTAQLVRVGLGGAWNAEFLTPTPTGTDEPSFERELARIRATAPDLARADLAVSWGGPLPVGLDRQDVPQRAAALLEWVWARTVLPGWPRRRRIIEADILARTARLGRGGWVAALEGLRPALRWLGEDRLQIIGRDYPPRELTGAQLLFVPVTLSQSWLSWHTPTDAAHRYAVVYPCSGVLAQAGQAAVPQALSRLLGPGRAGALVLLEAPKSTTQLVALTGQGLGSVGRHLKVLLDAGLVGRRRVGRSVLYQWTRAGEVLVRAQEADDNG